MRVKILEGNCLSALKSLPDESVHMVMTSPPYLGLRSYGTIPQVWGGKEGCKHEWSVIRTKRPNSSGGPSKKQSIKGSNNFRESTNYNDRASYSDYCSCCNAWRGELGMEPTPQEFIRHLVTIFKEVWRVLRNDGTCWINISDSYNGSGGAGGDYNEGGIKAGQPKYSGRKVPGLRPKELCGVPWKLAFALQDDGWLLRQDLIWAKGVSFCSAYSGSVMPEPVTDRCVRSHEYIFLLTKFHRYFFDNEAIREPNSTLWPESWGDFKRNKVVGKIADTEKTKEDFDTNYRQGGRNVRSVWAVPLEPYAGAHFAVFPQALITPCIKAGASEKGVCSKCGAPYERIIEKGEPIEEQKQFCGADSNGEYNGEGLKDYDIDYVQDASDVKRRILEGMIEHKTVGWKQTCKCKNPTIVPAVVLDPFGGSGTTALVAHNLDRDSISIELNPQYCDLQEKRLRDAADLFIEIERIKI
jgi:DNA modification methylase